MLLPPSSQRRTSAPGDISTTWQIHDLPRIGPLSSPAETNTKGGHVPHSGFLVSKANAPLSLSIETPSLQEICAKSGWQVWSTWWWENGQTERHRQAHLCRRTRVRRGLRSCVRQQHDPKHAELARRVHGNRTRRSAISRNLRTRARKGVPVLLLQTAVQQVDRSDPRIPHPARRSFGTTHGSKLSRYLILDRKETMLGGMRTTPKSSACFGSKTKHT